MSTENNGRFGGTGAIHLIEDEDRPQESLSQAVLFKAVTDLHRESSAANERSFKILADAQSSSTDRLVGSIEAVQAEIKSQGRIVLGLAVLGMLGVLALAGARLSGVLPDGTEFTVGEKVTAGEKKGPSVNPTAPPAAPKSFESPETSILP